jgi:ornithine cyclodeaminase/alanine dehydrogenase-like protein (mu-crystallin family)
VRLAEFAAASGGYGTIEVIDIAALRPAIEQASVIAMCTHADMGVFDGSWVRAGTHVSSVGSRAELPQDLVTASNVIVVDHDGAVTTPPPAGAAEVQHAAGAISVGSLLRDPRRGRTSGEQITVYKSTGHAVQDIAAAHLVYEKAVAAGLGVIVEL